MKKAEPDKVIEDAVKHTTSLLFSAYQGELLQYGDSVFTRFINHGISDPDVPLTKILRSSWNTASRVPDSFEHYMTVSRKPYVLYGVYHHDVTNNTSTVVLGGSISRERRSKNDARSKELSRRSTSTIICIRFDSAKTGKQMIEDLKTRSRRCTEKILKAPKVFFELDR